MQLRPGGKVVNNLFVRNSIALSVGGGNNPEAGGVTCDVRGNVVLDGKNIDAQNPRGWGMWFANIASGKVKNNLVANNTLGTGPAPITLDGDHQGDTHPSIGVHHLKIEKNVVFNWGGGVLIEGNGSQIDDVTLGDNDVQDLAHPYPLLDHASASSTANVHSQGNHFFSQMLPSSQWTSIGSSPQSMAYWFNQVGDPSSTTTAVSYGAADRSPATFNAHHGGTGTLAAFLDEARKQSATHWRPEYMAVRVNRYMRNGF
jgi:hypothetical protein